MAQTYLEQLEAESIYILREVAAEADKPALLYSIGKDSSVMLHLARKAFYPSILPFPLLHIDTTWKFKEMIAFRDQTVEDYKLKLLIHTNEEAIAEGITPFNHSPSDYTTAMKTNCLKMAISHYKFDALIIGSRRDEERSRSKERVFSIRNQAQHWDPKNQRPELWQLYNTSKKPNESFRVHPLSNWTELDIWLYILQENIRIPPLYFSAKRPVVKRDDNLIMIDDDRFPLNKNEKPTIKSVRFRTLGCYPLTSAMESKADTVCKVIDELILDNTSERKSRIIDWDSRYAMEKKKIEGYF